MIVSNITNDRAFRVWLLKIPQEWSFCEEPSPREIIIAVIGNDPVPAGGFW